MPVDCARAQFSRDLAKEEREIPKLRVYVLYGKRRKKKKREDKQANKQAMIRSA